MNTDLLKASYLTNDIFFDLTCVLIGLEISEYLNLNKPLKKKFSVQDCVIWDKFHCTYKSISTKL